MNDTKKVRVRLTVEYEVEVPADWDKEMVEFHRNESSWCANNLISELDEIFDHEDGSSCMCHAAHFEYIGEVSQ